MTTRQGQCLCGQLKWSMEGEPKALSVCHCEPCRITSSASASNNFLVPRDKLKLEGEVKQYTRKGDSGKNVTYQFCPICPTIVAVDAEAMPDIWIVKAGSCSDYDWLQLRKPDAEIYVKNRYSWLKPTGAEEKQASS